MTRYLVLLAVVLFPYLILAQAPDITSISPASAGVGATITITGTDFTLVSDVSFGGTPAASFIIDSPTQISAVVANGTSGDVSVTNPDGTDLFPGFTFFPPPDVTSFTPTGAASGATVTITGTNFSGATAVSFGGTAASSYTIDNDTQISAVVASGASGSVSVTTPGGTDALAGFTFIPPAPDVTSFTPTSAASGATVTINGTNFNGATAVSFGGIAATSFTIVNATQITAVVAAGASGNVSVTTPGGTAALAGFTFIAAPTITSFTPTSAASGTTVTINGTNFSGATAVSFGGIAATSFTIVNATQITAVVAAGASGNVSVTTPGGTAALAGFTFIAAPTITSFTPTSAANGATVTINGTNFSGATAVSFGGIAATSFNIVNATQITAVVAAGASGNVSVTTPGGTAALAGFTFIPAPTIASFTPTSAASGATVTINGTNFNGATAVSFGGIAATSFTIVNATQITAVVAAGASGNVSVTTPGGTAALAGFTFLPAPTIASFTPTSAASGATVTINGTNFSGATAVSFGGIAATSFTIVNATQITAVVAAGASGNVSITTPGGAAALAGFTFLPSPTIASFTPTSAASGATVTINGTNFSGATAVSFGGIAAASFTIVNATQITAVVAAGASGNVSVTTPGGTAALAGFTFIPAPTIASFTPTSAASGATVTINGTNFNGATAVSFGGIAATSFTIVNATQITAVVAAGASGNVSVTTPGGTAALAGFTFLPAPTIASFTPTSAASGATVTINGTNFSGATAVSFGGIAATSFTIVNATQITAVVAAGASGNVSVTTPGGAAALAGFTFLPSPTIASFTPTSAASGATVTINGTNFSGATAVSFGGIAAASFTIVNATQITAVVAAGASGNVSVTTPGGTAALAGFTFIPTPNITSFTPTSAASGATVTINGTNFSGATAVSFGGIAATSFTIVNATQITAVVAAGASGNVSVTTPGGTDFLAGFTFLPTPTVTSFLPISGAVGVVVTITGTNFSTVPANNTVSFNGTLATVNSASATSLTVTVPAGASSGPISVTVSGVTGTSAAGFTVLPTPTITGFSPTSGAVGATVTITGVNFGAVTNLAFNGTPAIVSSSTSTSITTTVPTGATTGQISFTSNGIDLITVSNFTVLATPTITGFSPTSGAPGAIVIITGTNFSPAPSVAFNGISATVISSNATSITTSVPSGASTGPISVTTRGVTIYSGGNFTVLATPTITGFSPPSGAIGTVVTISGTNFSATPSENIVSFNGTLANVSSSTATSITATVPPAATSGSISIVVSGITLTSSSSFIVLPTPTISNSNPTSGAIGATVIISGTNFSASPSVSFNGTAAIVTSSNATSITTTVPPGAVTGPISVTTSGITINSAFNFTVLPSPSISGFDPTSGAVGATVIISGSNFSNTPGNHIVRFNNTIAIVTASTTTSLTTTVPAGATTGKITVTVSGVTVTSIDDFTVLPTPSITGFSPAAAAVGATITISGNNFSTINANNVIRFNGVTALVTASTTNSITTSVPVGAGTGLISLTVNGITVFSASNFTVLPAPTITGFNPASGAVGANVIITGTNFGASPAVTINGTSATVTASTATSITTTVPAGATTGLITVTASGVTVNSSSSFTVLPSPLISGFSPASGSIGATVIITGSNFGNTPGDHVVRFNTTTAIVTAASPTSLTAIIPAGATTGKISVTVSGVTVISTNDFIILSNPTITGFSPSSGAVGAIVTVSGTNFNTPPTVDFNGTAATVASYTPTSITTSVPSGATTGAISIFVNGVEITSGSVFTVLPTPVITGFNPSSGAVGASVNISGNNFNTAPIVTFNGTPATVSSYTTSSIATSVPAGATTGLIAITVNSININSGSNFTVLPAPSISSFTPTSGAANAIITINGSNFNASPLVSFNGVSATVLSSNASSITVVVPEGTTTGKISVTTGGVTILSIPNFTVLPTPTIANFTPISGAVGATVTINGTNFGGSPAVQFNGVTAVVSSSNATSITTTVPVGAGSGPISVITSGVTISSASNFTVLPSPTITGFSPGSGAVGTPVVITGTNFSAIAANNVVRFNTTAAVVISSTSSSITTTVPPGASTGRISVIVSGVTIQSTNNFTILPSPTISGFSPSAAGVGVTVTITGTNFISAPLVEFNGTPAVVSSYNSSSITTTVPSGSGTGPISVSLSGVTVLSSSNFTVFGTPSITGFSPNNGVYGVPVTITGSNFSATAANNTVEFNGVTATVISSTTSSIITTVPVGATTGPISVTVNGITGNSSSNFTVPTPTIASFTPTSGAVGASVTITGTNFTNIDANNIVRFNGITALVTAATSTSITATVPAGASTGKISVTVGGVPGTSAADFTVLPTPTITSFSPVSGAIGALVIISGTNFSAISTDNVVRFNNTTAPVISSTTNSITTSVPAGATTGKISVTVSAVTISSVPNFTVLATPTITGFSPASGAIGASITITGTNFSTTPGNNLVEFNSVPAIVTGSTANSITATVPVGATTGKISITVSGVNLITATNFTVLPTPTFTGFSPNTGAAGTPVTITGTNFSTTPANNIVLFNGIASVVTSSTTNSLATTVPVGASTGPVSIIVSGITLTGGTFTVLPTPAIASLNPASGAEGATIVITGSNFSPTPSNNIVAFNGVTAVVIASTSTSITTTVPDGATTGKISLTLNGITIYSANNFMVLATPTLSGFSPSTGAAGATVTITGTNFSATEANNVVQFNGTTAMVSNSTPTTITTTVPVGATTGPITVTVSGITLTSASNFNVLPSPAITDFTPSSGAIGAPVIINGVNFSSTPGSNVIRFNNTTATTLSATPTRLTTTVPAGATTGKISVTTSGVTIQSATNFMVLATPTITGFTPASAAVGAIVTINGTNFNTPIDENVVAFNGIVADIISSTTNSISAVVPIGAITGPISVTVNGITRTTTTNFIVLASPTIVDITPMSAAVSATITITGTNFSPTPANNVVRFNGVNAVVVSSTTTSITVIVPNAATSGNITVTVSGVTISSATGFTILPTPTITGFNPTGAAVGAEVIITGTNFGVTPMENVVKFNGVTATVSASSSTSITTKVPAGASTGKISVTTSGVTINSATNFMVMPSPSIANFNPGFGLVGSIVNIVGLNFSSDESIITVTFNGVPGLVIASSPTLISTVVPEGATDGPISVNINGVTVFSSFNFDIIVIDTTAPELAENNSDTVVIRGTNARIQVRFDEPESNITSASVTFQYISNRGATYPRQLIKNGEYWEDIIPWDPQVGDLGVEYRLSATNDNGLTYTGEFIPVKVLFPGNGLTLPYSSYGSDISNYRIISVPLDLEKPSLDSVFNELPPYDKTKWRMSHYDNATNSNKELTRTSPIKAGVGYWLIVKDDPGTPLTTGVGKTIDVNPDPYTVQLKAGWNQIGNPYNFNIEWSDLLAANAGLPMTFRDFNGMISNFENKTTMDRLEGGFVNVASDMTLIYPVKKNTGSRIKSPLISLRNSIDQEEWEVDFTVKQADISNVIGGVGMRLDASEDFDIYDGFSMPRFNRYLDVNHDKQLNNYHYSKDVIPSTDNHTWKFKVDASSTDQQASISWDNSYLGSNDFNLILFDENSKVWVDMKQYNSYSFTPPTNFKVIYGSENHIKKEIGWSNAQILEVSPNPAKGPISIHLFLPQWQTKFPIQLELKSLTGITLANIFTGELESGYQKFEWSGENNSNPLPSGVYLIQMRCNNQIQTVRVVLLN